MTLVVPLALGGFAVLLMALVGAVNNLRAKKKATSRAVTSGPRILVHDINDDRCTGCDALSANRTAADDNPLLLVRVAVGPLARPPFPLEVLSRV